MLTKGFVVFVFVFSSGGLLIPLLRRENASGVAYLAGGQPLTVDTAQSDPITPVMWFGVYLITFFLVLVRWKRVLHVATRDKLLLLLVGVALFSVLWSVTPELTLRRSVALTATTVFGAYLATRYSLREQLQLLAWAMGIMALLSLAVSLTLPSYGIRGQLSTAGDWNGIFPHKNVLGRIMALSTIVFLHLAVSNSKHRWLMWTGAGLSCSLLYLSNSVTGLIVTIILLVLWLLYRALRWQHTLAVPFLISAGLIWMVVAIYLLNSAETVFGILQRDVTLTGRTELWAAVLDMSIPERPWLGYGYDSFWVGWEGPSAQIWHATNTRAAGAQNGILDLWLQLGLLGIVVFALQFLRSLLRAVAWARYAKTAEGLWPLVFLTYFVLYNITQNIILVQNSIYWILYTSTVLSLLARRGMYSNTHHLSVTSARAREIQIPGRLT